MTRLPALPLLAATGAAVLAVAAVPAPAAPSPGDVAARRALEDVVRIDSAARWTIDVMIVGASPRDIPGLEGRARAFRAAMGAARAGVLRTRPTTGEGRRVRRLGARAALLEREYARLVGATARAHRAGAERRAAGLEKRVSAVYGQALTTMGRGMRIVLPDPLARVDEIRLVGVVSVPADGDPDSAPIAADAGGVMTRCSPRDAGIGWRIYAHGVHGRSLLRFAIAEPSGAVTRQTVRIRAAVDGVEVTPTVRATGDGPYRLTVEQDGRVLLDAPVTRACALPSGS